jgi:hypothetical protein
MLPTSNSGASPPRGGPSESSLMAVHCWIAKELTQGTSFTTSFVQCPAMTADHYDIGYITIDMFPNEVLLEIFAFYLCGDGDEEEWQMLVHMCQRWRSIVFGSPLSLNLQIGQTYTSFSFTYHHHPPRGLVGSRPFLSPLSPWLWIQSLC